MKSTLDGFFNADRRPWGIGNDEYRDELQCKDTHRIRARLFPNIFGERAQPFFNGSGSFCFSPWFIWKVDIFEIASNKAGQDLRFQLFSKLSLTFDCPKYGLTALLEPFVIETPLVNVANLHLIEISGCLLAIAGNEGYGGSGFKQAYRSFHARNRGANFCADS